MVRGGTHESPARHGGSADQHRVDRSVTAQGVNAKVRMAGAMRKMAVYLGLAEDEADGSTSTATPRRRVRLRRVRGPEPPSPRPSRPPGPEAGGATCRRRLARTTPARWPRSAAHRAAERRTCAASGPRAGRPGRRLPDHHDAPAHLQRGQDHRRGLPRRHPGHHEPHRHGATPTPSGSSTSPPAWCSGCTAPSSGSPPRSSCSRPANVEVTAEDKARIAEAGFFNQS